MQHKINTSNTFKAIRQLPLAVSFQQVENWVRQQPKSHTRPVLRLWPSIIKWLKR